MHELLAPRRPRAVLTRLVSGATSKRWVRRHGRRCDGVGPARNPARGGGWPSAQLTVADVVARLAGASVRKAPAGTRVDSDDAS